MADSPWLGDACSLVDAFRSGERSPVEELEASLRAIERSELNAFSFLDPDAARDSAARADVMLPFGGVPIGVKELDAVRGWPATEASVPLKDRVSPHDSTMVARLREAGAVPFGLTTSSEFGGVNLTRTNLNGVTRNPWDTERTPGGSSGGAAAAVAGGLITLATGGDGGGSIRIPCGFTGLLGMKNTYGRIPKGPRMCVSSLTAVTGCLARSARDVARHLDATNGYDSRDPYSLPRVEGYEAGLDSHDLRGKKAVIVPDLGVAVLHPELADAVAEHGRLRARPGARDLGPVAVNSPELSMEWAFAGLAEVRKDLGDLYPECEAELTFEIALGLKIAEQAYNLQARANIEAARIRMNETMAEIFEQVDFVIASTNPEVAFGAEGPLPSKFNDVEAGFGNNGALTIPANIYGSPAVSIPIGTSRGLPIGMQVLAPHHREGRLLDLARIVERERPWPLVAPGAPL